MRRTLFAFMIVLVTLVSPVSADGALEARALDLPFTLLMDAPLDNGELLSSTALIVDESTEGQVRLRVAPAASSGLAQIVASDITFLGYYNVPSDGTSAPLQGDFSFARGGFAIKKVGGVNHFFIAQSVAGCLGGAGAPCDGSPVEFSEPATFNASGTCTSGSCPNATLLSGPNVAYVTNWGLNDNLSYTNFTAGLNFAYWADDGSNTLGTDCATCLTWWSTITPNGDYLMSYGIGYGLNHIYAGMVLTTLDSNTAGVRTVHAYGPLVAQTPAGYGGDVKTADFAARYFVHMPNGKFCFGSGDSGAAQQGGAPNGPSVMCAPSWPTSATTVAYNTRLAATETWLRYYNLNGRPNPDGSLPGGQPNISYRHPFLWPYVFEGDGIDPQGGQGAFEALNPAMNSGVGTWTETSHVLGVIPILTATKQGAIAFMTTGTNHLVGTNTTSCTSAGQVVARPWYCSGPQGCADSMSPNLGLSPVYRCPLSYQVTGPTTTTQEAQWAIFRWADMAAVAAGTKTDYTVEPTEAIFPEIAYGLELPPSSNAELLKMTIPADYYDAATNNFYVLIPQQNHRTAFIRTPVIGVFHVAQ